MTHIPNTNFLDKARRHYRGERAKDPTLPALVPGGGQIRANGKLCVELERVDGSTVAYSFRPITEWRLTQEPCGLKPHGNGESVETSPSQRVHQALDIVLSALADAERHVSKPQPGIAA